MSPYYSWQQGALILNCYLQPKASKTGFAGPHQGYLKIRVTAPPVEGKANTHLLKFIAKTFAVRTSQVELLSGKTSRYKKVRINSPVKIPTQLDITPAQAAR